ncbi:hypothetical protein GCM10009647_079910 [Streptomyces sanglieri]
MLEAESPFPTVHVHQDNMESGDVSYEVGGCSPFSSPSPAEIEILVSNNSPDDKLEFPGDSPLRWESGIPKPHIESPSDSPSHLDVYLKDIASRQNLVPPAPDEGCWRASTSPQIDDTNEEQVILEPGESRTWEFVLLENATTSECLLEEKYMIENQSLPGNFKFELELEY